METTTTAVETTTAPNTDRFCIEQPSNTMIALTAICCVLALFIMFRFTDKRGFWWGVGFWLIGGFTGSAIGRLIEKPTEKCF